MTHVAGQIVKPTRLYSLFRYVVLSLAVVGPSCEDVEPQPPRRQSARSRFDNGDLSFENLTIPREEIRVGGPPKDGIPAISDPDTIGASEASFLRPESRIIGVTIGNRSRAWPIAILNYHEIINDTLGETPVAVTYCPLCDSAVVFDRRTEGGVREFGVSGLLYNSNVLMYERVEGEQSLFSQLKGQAVSGPHAGRPLKTLPVELTNWMDWQVRHPDTTVMSLPTVYQRDYSISPYGDYFTSSRLMFPVRKQSDRLPPKQKVLGLWHGGSFLAVPLSLTKRDPGEFKVAVGDKNVRLAADSDTESIRVVSAGVEWMYSLWFAWYAFQPDTGVCDP